MKKYSIFISILVISALHYFTPISHPNLHAVYQRLYYIPIIFCASWFGFKSALLVAILSSLAYVPHIVLHWAHMPLERFTQYIEIIMFLIIGSLVGFFSDNQRKQRKLIEDTHAQMRRMDRMSLLGQLAAGLAHEIRNPLGSLIGSDEILAESLGKEHPKYEFIEILQKEHRRLRDKLNHFLTFARPAPACLILNNINDVVRATVQLVDKQAAKNGCTVKLNLDDTLPEIALDADQMKQALLNLILNACQEMTEGGTITVSSWSNAPWTCVSVQDEGKGIDPKSMDRIFEPFYTTKPEGTGLGLAIVKQLAETMNGTVDVQSDKTGSRFTIRIPHEQKKHTDH